ncbi:DUF1592 domain-containing protein [Myxococcota bacterium]|nr:DUF1592 domain-containing protein [Myxococcota bacterium]
MIPRTLAVFAVCFVLWACRPTEEPPSVGGPTAMRRLTGDQYKQAVSDVFGDDIVVAGRFAPDARRKGLVAVGSTWGTMTPASFEQFESMALSIAAQVVGETHRSRLVECQPASSTQPDDECAGRFLRRVGRQLFRRPLTDEEVQARVEIAANSTRSAGDFHAGLEFALASLLMSPDFLFRIERSEADPLETGRMRLTSETVASRLSYFLWNASPDEQLMAAAENGRLLSVEGLGEQVDRMLESPRVAEGMRAFFADVFSFDEFEDVSKDTILYPAFSRKLVEDSQEQTLRVIIDHLIDQRGDYRDLFTTRKSFMTRTLGLVYGVPVATREGWEPFEFSEGSQRSGLHTHVSFMTLHSHPGRSSPTLRGVFLREAILCQEVPAAPADVNFTIVQDTDNPEFKTARARLDAHSTDPTCANCHRIMDPIGLGLDTFDAIGRYRKLENGVPIDTSGDVSGEAFSDTRDLGQVLHDHPAVSACLVEKLYRYGVGRDTVMSERHLLRYLEDRFEDSGYRLHALLRLITLSEAFRTTSGARSVEKDLGQET